MPPVELDGLVEAAVRRAYRWAAATGGGDPAERRGTERLAELVHDPAGVAFTMEFVDRVARPQDDAVAAAELVRLARGPHVPAFLARTDRALLALGARAAPLAPALVMPLARRRLRQLVGHLVRDAGSRELRQALRAARAEGVRLNLNLLGEAVLGDAEAGSRLRRTIDLLADPEVDYVSVKASSVAAQLDPWDPDGSRDRLVEALLPLYRAARDRPRPAFVNLDMEEYKDLHLTLDAFEVLLSRPELAGLPAGIALQAYLPDSWPAMRRLAGLALARVAAGGAPIKLRLVKGANLAMERVEAQLHGWPPAPFEDKAEVDANYVRILDAVLRPELAGALRLGVASHNLFDLALARELAVARGVTGQLDVEMLQGMAPAQARAVLAEVGSLILYTPVVHPGDFDVAIAYLVRRLEENAAPENFLYSLFGRAPGGLAGQEERFRASVRDRHRVPDGPRRTQDRSSERPPVPGPGFRNAPDTDPALPANQAWASAARRAPLPPVSGHRAQDEAAVDAVLATAAAAAGAWAATPAAERAALLRHCAAELERARGRLLTAMVAEAGKTVAEADPEVSEAVDFATYYAEQALALEREPGAVFTPAGVVLVTPPWNFPVAIPLGGVLAGLAAGCAVVIKPAPQTPVCAEVGVAALHAAFEACGVPRDVLQLVHTGEGAAGRRLVTHPGVGVVLLTGASATAAAFRGWAPQLRLVAETSGKNAIVVTPSADLDLAVADVVRSAFGHAGQKCSAASLLICVGSVAGSKRFRRQLVDAVASLRVGPATEPSSTMGPLIEAPSDRLERALTTLEPGQRWLVRPRPLGGTLWTPGLVDGVRPGQFLHRTELFGPVLGLMAAPDLETAIDWQNGTGYGLTGGLHSLDEREIARWLDRVEVGNAYLNRHLTGAIVGRQPFGGWKASVLGPGAKAGGPNYVAQLGRWADGELGELPGAAPGPAAARIVALAGDADAAWLAAAARADQAAWERVFAREHDPSGLAVEANPLRYRPLPVLGVRAGPGTRRALLRVLLAAARSGTQVRVSSAEPLDLPPLPGVAVRMESDRELAAGLAAAGRPDRLRALVPLPGTVLRAAAEHGVSVLDAEPVASGRRELLTVLREQSISRTRHRFGHLEGGA